MAFSQPGQAEAALAQGGTWTRLVPAGTSHHLSAPLPGLRGYFGCVPIGVNLLKQGAVLPRAPAKGSLRAGAALLLHIPPRGYHGCWGG